MKKLLPLLIIIIAACTMDINIVNYYDGGFTTWSGDSIYYLRNLFGTPGYLDYYDLYVIDINEQSFSKLNRYNVFLSRSVPVCINAEQDTVFLVETKFLLKLTNEDYNSDTIMNLGFAQYNTDKGMTAGVDEQYNALLIDNTTLDTTVLGHYEDSVFRFSYDFSSGSVYAIIGHMDNTKKLWICRQDTTIVQFGTVICGKAITGFEDMKIEGDSLMLLAYTDSNEPELFIGPADRFPDGAVLRESRFYNKRPDGMHFEITPGNEKLILYSSSNLPIFTLDLPENP